MKLISGLSIGCSILLLVGLFALPAAYNNWVKIVIALLAVAVVLREITLQRRLWALLFLAVAYLFNPFSAVQHLSKEANIVLDTGIALLFMLYAVFNKLEEEK